MAQLLSRVRPQPAWGPGTSICVVRRPGLTTLCSSYPASSRPPAPASDSGGLTREKLTQCQLWWGQPGSEDRDPRGQTARSLQLGRPQTRGPRRPQCQAGTVRGLPGSEDRDPRGQTARSLQLGRPQTRGPRRPQCQAGAVRGLPARQLPAVRQEGAVQRAAAAHARAGQANSRLSSLRPRTPSLESGERQADAGLWSRGGPVVSVKLSGAVALGPCPGPQGEQQLWVASRPSARRASPGRCSWGPLDKQDKGWASPVSVKLSGAVALGPCLGPQGKQQLVASRPSARRASPGRCSWGPLDKQDKGWASPQGARVPCGSWGQPLAPARSHRVRTHIVGPQHPTLLCERSMGSLRGGLG
nr:uncharacterized protein LOC103345175 isoform X1 [Oryctolagus cuniculus]